MKKIFAILLLIPTFLTPSQIISTEQELSQADESLQYGMAKTVIDDLTYFQSIPEKAISTSDLVIYSDSNLTKPKKMLAPFMSISVQDIQINDDLLPVFLLKDGSYTLASQKYIADDTILNQQYHEGDYWLNDGFTIYKEPYRVGVPTVKTKLSSYTKIKVLEEVETLHGNYLRIENQGWVSKDDVSALDNRLEKVSKLLETKYKKKDNLAVSIHQLSTGLHSGVNQDKVMYSASTAKLPVLYYVQQQINQGKVSLSDRLKYTDEVNNFEGAYHPEGSGYISKTADDKEYSVEELLKAVAQESDNVATNILAYYIADKYDQDYQNTIGNIAKWDPISKEVSPRTASLMMNAIYHQDGEIVDYLSATKFDDQRIPKDIDAPVAHKIGDAYDFRHDVAIIYGDNPFILSIFTENMTYDDISDISKEIYNILK